MNPPSSRRKPLDKSLTLIMPVTQLRVKLKSIKFVQLQNISNYTLNRFKTLRLTKESENMIPQKPPDSHLSRKHMRPLCTVTGQPRQ